MNKMTVYEGAGVNADTLRIVVEANQIIVYDKTYYCGYEYSWCKAFATTEKPFKDDLIQQLAKKYNVEQDIEYREGKRLVY